MIQKITKTRKKTGEEYFVYKNTENNKFVTEEVYNNSLKDWKGDVGTFTEETAKFEQELVEAFDEIKVEVPERPKRAWWSRFINSWN